MLHLQSACNNQTIQLIVLEMYNLHRKYGPNVEIILPVKAAK